MVETLEIFISDIHASVHFVQLITDYCYAFLLFFTCNSYIMATPSVTGGEAAEMQPLPVATPPPPVNVSEEHPISSSADDKINQGGGINEATDAGRFSRLVDGLISKADQLEQRVNEVSYFYASRKQGNSKGTSALKEKEKEKQDANSNSNNNDSNCACNSDLKKPMDGYRPQVVCPKRMQELMRQFGTVLRQLSQHKWAWPFLEPVDVEGLGLHDYYEVIKKPMDFSSIRKQMDARDGTGYKNVSDIYSDARLVFNNAMIYNDERTDVHVMAKTLLAKLEEKWLPLWPKVVEEEKRQKEEEAQAMTNMKIAREAAMAKMATDTCNELNELSLELEELREMVVQRCRKWSTEEKRKLGAGLSTLSTDDLNKALQVISQSNPNFQAGGEVVEFDMDAQNDTTLWRLKFFVREAMELQAKNSLSKAYDSMKRRTEIADDPLAKTAKKKTKKLTAAAT